MEKDLVQMEGEMRRLLVRKSVCPEPAREARDPEAGVTAHHPRV